MCYAGRGKIVVLGDRHESVSEITPSTRPAAYGLQQVC